MARRSVTVISSAGVPGTVLRLPHEVTIFILVATNELLISIKKKKNGTDAMVSPGSELEGLGQTVLRVGPQSACPQVFL